MRRAKEISRLEYLRGAERSLERARTSDEALGRALARAALRYVKKAFEKKQISRQNVELAQLG